MKIHEKEMSERITYCTFLRYLVTETTSFISNPHALYSFSIVAYYYLSVVLPRTRNVEIEKHHRRGTSERTFQPKSRWEHTYLPEIKSTRSRDQKSGTHVVHG